MRLSDKMKAFRISDNDLDNISGGTAVQNERGEEVKEGRFITTTLSNYSSSAQPRYSAGDFVKIKWHISSQMDVLCNAEVLGVNDGHMSGVLFRKYTYSVRILSCPNSDMIGMIENNVHENCLFL